MTSKGPWARRFGRRSPTTAQQEDRSTGSRTAATHATFLFSSAVVAQGISIVALIFAARIFSVAGFGEYAVFTSHHAILGSVVLLSFPKAIPNIPDDQVPASVVALLVLGVLVGCLAYLAYSLAGYGYAAAMGLAVLGRALVTLFETMCLRVKQFAVMSLLRVLSPAILLAGILAAWLLDDSDAAWLVWSMTAGQLVAGLVYAIVVLMGLGKLQPRVSSMIAFLVDQRRFALYVAPSELFNRAAYHLPVIMIEAIFSNGTALAGQYGLALRLCLRPVGLLGMAVGKVFHADFAERVRSGPSDLGPDFRSLTRRLAIVAVILVGGVFFASPLLARFIGDAWSMSVLFLKVLAPLFGAMILVAPISPALYIFEQHRFLLFNQLAYLGIAAFAFGLGVFIDDIVVAVVVFSVLSCVRYALTFGMIARLVQRTALVPGESAKGLDDGEAGAKHGDFRR